MADLLTMPRRSMANQSYSGIRSYCFSLAYSLEASPFLYYIAKTAMGVFVAAHFALSSFFFYQKVRQPLMIDCEKWI